MNLPSCNPRVVTVVVTFNRLELLKRCVQAVRNQTLSSSSILVVNNGSTDGTSAWLSQQADLITFNQANLGGAGGFHRGIREALALSLDWIWCMDDDAEPHPDALEKLMQSRAAADPNTSAVTSTKFTGDGRIQTDQNGIINRKTFHISRPAWMYESDEVEIDCPSFVALALKADVVRDIGLPRADFFIGQDDVEYGFRLRSHGKIVLIRDSRVTHWQKPEESIVISAFFWKFRHEPIDLYWKLLSIYRNYDYVRRTYFGMSIAGSVLRLLKRLVENIVEGDHVLLRIKWTLKYYRDSFRHEFTSVSPTEWARIVKQVRS